MRSRRVVAPTPDEEGKVLVGTVLRKHRSMLSRVWCRCEGGAGGDGRVFGGVISGFYVVCDRANVDGNVLLLIMNAPLNLRS